MKLNVTALSIILVAVVSYGLYQLSYEVQRLETDLGVLKNNISENKEDLRILKAEWAYQNRPDVLQALARKYLPLLLIAPYQVASIDNLPDESTVVSTLDVPLPRLNPKRDYAAPVKIPSGSIQLATYSSPGETQ
ncbi:hypothetical protein [Sneathiella sp.]|uniref:cell division protein FtsL n=1 Tax=Sneathiella sp. TaxID=1964365 RepID=UPI0035632803